MAKKKRKYPRSTEKHTIYNGIEESAYATWNDEKGKEEAMASLDKAVGDFTGVTTAAYRHISMDGIGGQGISGRHGLTNEGYEAFRPREQSRFRYVKETILASDLCYKNHGLIRNIIDLMGDFACQGIRLVHPNKRIEKFYQNWFNKVNGKERSERFLNHLYRLGNVVVRIQTASPTEESKKRLYKTMAAAEKAKAKPDLDMSELRKKVEGTEIPIKYNFIHPATVDVVGGSLSSFVGNPRYAIKIPDHLRRKIMKPKSLAEKKLVAQLPDEIKRAAKSRDGYPLPENKTRVFHYRKDDWDDWAEPMISGILIDISLYEKLKLADRAALDGAISNIRIFKLGNLEHKIIPTEVAAQKLSSILQGNTNAGTLDLIWGPDIELVESKTSVHQFLGMTKYEPTLLAIYAGVGIPPTLTGTFGASGTTNNFISLKTFVKRLEYGREVLAKFWNEQIRIIQEQMGFRFPAKIEFDFDDLGDEAAEKALLIQLADRDLVSQEYLQRRFKHDPEMEAVRLKRENKEREKSSVPNKAGPFHDPQIDEGLKKVALQAGVVTPSQVGLDLKPNKRGEVPAIKIKTAAPPAGGKPAPKKGIPQQGRPKNSKDSNQRKQKDFKPKTKAEFDIWASDSQNKIDEIVNPGMLQVYGKSSMRSLSSAEAEEVEMIKFGVLYNLDPFQEINNQSVYNSLDKKLPEKVLSSYKALCSTISNSLDRKLSIDERKKIQAQIYNDNLI